LKNISAYSTYNKGGEYLGPPYALDVKGGDYLGVA